MLITIRKLTMTQDIYQKAIKFAGEKHKNQTVPGTNSNYLLHLSNVAMELLIAHNANPNFDIDFAIQIALLHDTIEDTETPFKELQKEFGSKIAIAVQALTKDNTIVSKHQRMVDSLNRVNALQKEVGMVKLADRITNLQMPPDFWNKEKTCNYYKESKLIDTMLINKNEYLNLRLKTKITDYKKYML